MLFVSDKNKKCCWICGKDVALEHCTMDEHGLSVHSSCHEKRMLLKAASFQTATLLRKQPKSAAA
jgi:hypothetical protein